MKLHTAARGFLCFGVVLSLLGCTPAGPSTAPTVESLPPTPAVSATIPQPFTATAALKPSRTTPPTGTPAVDTPVPVSQVCSPLEGILLSELTDPNLLKNPFQAPRPGQDDGHHGADFAYWSWGERTTMLGLPIHSVLDGRVAGIIRNRPPYGNAVIIETPLDMLPAGWKGPIPTPAPTVPPAGNLFCPPDPIHTGAGSERSLYLLYAHMNQTPNLTIGQAVGCGEVIGEVGTTGKSVNYHLHLETRAGPAGTQFASMAHYDNAASDEEMRNYCAWRVSGLFQMIDPLELLR